MQVSHDKLKLEGMSPPPRRPADIDAQRHHASLEKLNSSRGHVESDTGHRNLRTRTKGKSACEIDLVPLLDLVPLEAPITKVDIAITDFYIILCVGAI